MGEIRIKSFLRLALVVFCVGFFVFGVGDANAAASLVISSATVSADGKRVDIAIAGNNGDVSPLNNITGFKIKITKGGLKSIMNVSSVVASGAIVTLNLSSMILAGEIVTVDLVASPTSNLTDVVGNTPFGQVDFAVINSSSLAGTTVKVSDPGGYLLGSWSNGVSVGHPSVFQSGYWSKFETVISGTDADIQIYANGTTYTFMVDGNVSTITPTGNQWMWVSLFSGKSNTGHSVSVYAGTTVFYIDSENSIRIAASSGAGISSPPGYGTYYKLNEAPFASFGQIDGSPGRSNLQGYNNFKFFTAGDGVVRFKASASDIWLWSYDGGSSVALLQDGVQVGENFIAPGGTKWSLWHIGSLLDGQPHEYEIIGINTISSYYPWAIMIAGGSLINEVQSPKLTLASYGDSIVSNSSAGFTDSRLGFGWIASRALGMSSARKGNSSQKVSTFLRDNASQITTLSPSPKIVIMQGGVNDMSGNVTIGNSSTPNTFIGDYKSMLTSVGSSMSAGSKMIVRGILESNASNNINRATYVSAQQAAVDAYMAGSPVVPAYFYDTVGWINLVNDLNDSVHPNASGNSKIANREIPILTSMLDSSSYTITGPSTGEIGATSTVFTVSLANTATFTGNQTITISDGEMGGTITPSVGSPAVNSVTVTPANGASSFTFTYTPASFGAKTLAFTNGQQLWTNPNSVYYSVNDVNAPTSGTISINAGDANTNNTSSTLTLSAVDNLAVTQMKFSTDDVTYDTAISYATSQAYTLPSGSGTKTVYVKFGDSANNWSSAVSDTIVLDTVSPTTSADITTGLFNTAQNITLTCNDGIGSGCDKIYFTTDGSNPTTFSSEYSTPINIPISTTLKYFATDLAGNSEAIKSQPYVIDTQAPIIAGISNNQTYYTSKNPTFNEGSATLNGDAYISGTAISAVGDYALIVTDAAANSTTVTFTIAQEASISPPVVVTPSPVVTSSSNDNNKSDKTKKLTAKQKFNKKFKETKKWIQKQKITFGRNLSLGSQGKDVEKLQAILQKMGLMKIEDTTYGVYKSATKQAVAKFQKYKNILQTGNFGLQTRDLFR